MILPTGTYYDTKMIKQTMLLGALLGSALAASAPTAASAQEGNALRFLSPIVLKYYAVLPDSSGTMLGVSAEVLDLISSQAPLANLEVNDRMRDTELKIEFAFANMNAFTAWYESATTRSMFESIRVLAISRPSHSLALNRRVGPAGRGIE